MLKLDSIDSIILIQMLYIITNLIIFIMDGLLFVRKGCFYDGCF